MAFCNGLDELPLDVQMKFYVGKGFCREFSMRTERGLFHSQVSRSQDVELLDER